MTGNGITPSSERASMVAPNRKSTVEGRLTSERVFVPGACFSGSRVHSVSAITMATRTPMAMVISL